MKSKDCDITLWELLCSSVDVVRVNAEGEGPDVIFILSIAIVESSTEVPIDTTEVHSLNTRQPFWPHQWGQQLDCGTLTLCGHGLHQTRQI